MSRNEAVRVLASELNQAVHQFTLEDRDQAPKYSTLPTGGVANRVLIAGTITEIEDVGSDSPYLRARVVDPAGDTYFCYAGQYDQEAMADLNALEPPAYVVMPAKLSTFETDDEEVRVSVEPESVNVVDEATRDTWVVETAKHTLDRIEEFDPAADLESIGPVEASNPRLGDTLAVTKYDEETIDETHEAIRQKVALALESVSDGISVEEEADEQAEPEAQEQEAEVVAA